MAVSLQPLAGHAEYIVADRELSGTSELPCVSTCLRCWMIINRTGYLHCHYKKIVIVAQRHIELIFINSPAIVGSSRPHWLVNKGAIAKVSTRPHSQNFRNKARHKKNESINIVSHGIGVILIV